MILERFLGKKNEPEEIESISFAQKRAFLQDIGNSFKEEKINFQDSKNFSDEEINSIINDSQVSDYDLESFLKFKAEQKDKRVPEKNSQETIDIITKITKAILNHEPSVFGR